MKKPDALTDYELHQRYDDMLDEVYGEAKIGGYEYSTSKAMKEVDPTAYRCGFSDWLDSECQSDVLIEVDGEYYDFSDFKEYQNEVELENE